MDAPTDVLLQHWPGGLFRQATDLRFEFLSPRIADWTGHPPEAFLERPELLFECVHRRDLDAFRAHVHLAASAAGRSIHFRFRHSTTGRATHVSEFRRGVFDPDGRVRGSEGFWQDETRLTLAERRLESAAWKEALSELTGGFAHDFNNVFGAVHSLSDTFISQVEPGHPFHEGLSLMKRDTRQAGQLVQRLQQLHLIRAGQRAYHDLNALVADTTELLLRGLSRRVEIATELAPGQLPIHADAAGLQHVIVALVLNATEAMSGGGRVVMRTRLLVEPRPPEGFAGTWPGPRAIGLSIQDTGPGFTPRRWAAILERGITTRPASLGIGLGILHALRFAERHCGGISVESAPGSGTTIHLWLPQTDFKETNVVRDANASGSGAILLAGQSAGELPAIADALGRRGFRVVLADETTLELLASADHDIEVLLVRASSGDATATGLIDFIRRHRLPVKVFIQPVGCAVDTLDPELLVKADAMLAEDLSEERLAEKLTKLLSGA